MIIREIEAELGDTGGVFFAPVSYTVDFFCEIGIYRTLDML